MARKLDGVPDGDEEFTFSTEELYARYDNDLLDLVVRTGGATGLGRVARVHAIDEEWTEAWLQWVYGHIHTRDVLDPKTKALVALGMHTVMYNDRGAVSNMKNAIRNGATHKEVIEVILHAAPYRGFPATHRQLDLYRVLRDSGELET